QARSYRYVAPAALQRSGFNVVPVVPAAPRAACRAVAAVGARLRAMASGAPRRAARWSEPACDLVEAHQRAMRQERDSARWTYPGKRLRAQARSYGSAAPAALRLFAFNVVPVVPVAPRAACRAVAAVGARLRAMASGAPRRAARWSEP